MFPPSCIRCSQWRTGGGSLPPQRCSSQTRSPPALRRWAQRVGGLSWSPVPNVLVDVNVELLAPNGVGHPLGSVIVDMAAEMGGNVEGTEPGKEVVRHGVRIIGLTNLPATMPGSATQMYAKNIQTLVKHLVRDGELTIDLDDEITRGATITHAGKVVHEATAKALGIEVTPPAPAKTEKDA